MPPPDDTDSTERRKIAKNANCAPLMPPGGNPEAAEAPLLYLQFVEKYVLNVSAHFGDIGRISNFNKFYYQTFFSRISSPHQYERSYYLD